MIFAPYSELFGDRSNNKFSAYSFYELSENSPRNILVRDKHVSGRREPQKVKVKEKWSTRRLIEKRARNVVTLLTFFCCSWMRHGVYVENGLGKFNFSPKN